MRLPETTFVDSGPVEAIREVLSCTEVFLQAKIVVCIVGRDLTVRGGKFKYLDSMNQITTVRQFQLWKWNILGHSLLNYWKITFSFEKSKLWLDLIHQLHIFEFSRPSLVRPRFFPDAADDNFGPQKYPTIAFNPLYSPPNILRHDLAFLTLV